MTFQTPAVCSEEEALKSCRERRARAEAEFQQVAQRFEQACSLSVVTALPVTEAYRFIATHGLGFTAIVEEWLLSGFTIPQAIALAAQGRGTEMVAMRRLAAERGVTWTRFASSLKPAACRGCQHDYGQLDGITDSSVPCIPMGLRQMAARIGKRLIWVNAGKAKLRF